MCTYLQLQKLYNNSLSVRSDLQILSDRFEDGGMTGNFKRQAEPSVLVPIVFTAQLLDNTTSVEQVTQEIENAVSSGEIIGFSAVGMYLVCINSTYFIMYYTFRYLYMPYYINSSK